MLLSVIKSVVVEKQTRGHFQYVSYPEFSWTNLFLAYGTMVFSYGGHSAFPTIQHDMKRPSQFSKSVVVSYVGKSTVAPTANKPGISVTLRIS